MASFDVDADADAVEEVGTNPITDFSLSVYSLLMFREEPDAPNTAGATFSFDAFLAAYCLKIRDEWTLDDPLPFLVPVGSKSISHQRQITCRFPGM